MVANIVDIDGQPQFEAAIEPQVATASAAAATKTQEIKVANTILVSSPTSGMHTYLLFFIGV